MKGGVSKGPLPGIILVGFLCWQNILNPLCEGPLVVPLDCEWIWHFHRLNPVLYKSDCEMFYGRILDNSNVVSTVGGTLIETSTSEEICKNLYPNESFELDLADTLNDNSNVQKLGGEKCTIDAEELKVMLIGLFLGYTKTFK
ncbi:glycine-rich domain-containing protein 2-like isoform X2 [Henckelia pumila]|uniref:glycine-rich domain-containing protein 2-like isoform X2 n=1 Tax=Henckelia pumila TaxID=405737 RepID=UPI003C6E97FC